MRLSCTDLARPRSSAAISHAQLRNFCRTSRTNAVKGRQHDLRFRRCSRQQRSRGWTAAGRSVGDLVHHLHLSGTEPRAAAKPRRTSPSPARSGEEDRQTPGGWYKGLAWILRGGDDRVRANGVDHRRKPTQSLTGWSGGLPARPLPSHRSIKQDDGRRYKSRGIDVNTPPGHLRTPPWTPGAARWRHASSSGVGASRACSVEEQPCRKPLAARYPPERRPLRASQPLPRRTPSSSL